MVNLNYFHLMRYYPVPNLVFALTEFGTNEGIPKQSKLEKNPSSQVRHLVGI
jgi:hypothetical protein